MKNLISKSCRWLSAVAWLAASLSACAAPVSNLNIRGGTISNLGNVRGIIFSNGQSISAADVQNWNANTSSIATNATLLSVNGVNLPGTVQLTNSAKVKWDVSGQVVTPNTTDLENDIGAASQAVMNAVGLVNTNVGVASNALRNAHTTLSNAVSNLAGVVSTGDATLTSGKVSRAGDDSMTGRLSLPTIRVTATGQSDSATAAQIELRVTTSAVPARIFLQPLYTDTNHQVIVFSHNAVLTNEAWVRDVPALPSSRMGLENNYDAGGGVKVQEFNWDVWNAGAPASVSRRIFNINAYVTSGSDYAEFDWYGQRFYFSNGATGLLISTVADPSLWGAAWPYIRPADEFDSVGMVIGSGYGNLYLQHDVGQTNHVIMGVPAPNRVGIGTTNPLAKLHVAGDAVVSGTVTAGAFVGNGAGLTGLTSSGTSEASNDARYLKITGTTSTGEQRMKAALVMDTNSVFGASFPIRFEGVHDTGLSTNLYTNHLYAVLGDLYFSVGYDGAAASGKVFTTLNDGSGSGLDADTVDGLSGNDLTPLTLFQTNTFRPVPWGWTFTNPPNGNYISGSGTYSAIGFIGATGWHFSTDTFVHP